MAVAVSRDLTVQVLEDLNAVKLTNRQQALRTAIQRGEPRCLGVSQVMLGLMIMSYSIPLHFTEFTEVVILGVPWWSGLTLQTCLIVSVVSTVLSVVAVIIYSVDMDKNPEEPCVKMTHGSCNEKHYATKVSRGVKSSLLLFTLAQTVISAILCFLLYRQRRIFGPYGSLTQDAPSTLISLTPPDLN
ncbi:transmembrane protein 176 [Scomber japonicus]|uniref:transmembrane protein 176 n=1 Tax=Scomber japonicus TaxID=13676 RepID=UPI0023056176|nr:transmembrane protein 176 [Scomber japonicus]